MTIEEKTLCSSEEEIVKCLLRCVKGVASGEEYDRVWHWAQEPEHRQLYRAVLDAAVAEQLSTAVDKGQKERLWHELVRRNHRARRIRRARWLAAAAVVLIAGSVAMFNFLPKNQDKTIIYLTQHQQRMQVMLPDSTEVWLNANSRLEYPEDFGHERRVMLSGEAWFDVRKNGRPFTVHTEQATVEVHGTRFSVSDYSDASATNIILVNGQVTVTAVVSGQAMALTPNQKWTLNKGDRRVTVSTVDASMATSWVSGRMSFKQASLHDIFEHLGHWYNVRFILPATQMDDCHLSFTVKNEPLQHSLQIIKALAPMIDFTQKGSEIIVTKK